MSRAMPRKWLLRVGSTVLAASLSTSVGVDSRVMAAAQAPPPPVPSAPAFTPTPLQPSLADFVTGMPVSTCCQIKALDPLLRPPFAGAPLADPKGLAAKIRAEQLDAKKRVKAVKYLGTVDCVAYPEAKAMLVQVMENDKYEQVRYEAAKALGVMMGRGKSRRDQFIANHGRARRYDTCRGCCDEKALKALAHTAYDLDDFGCPVEPSKRVRDAALAAIRACGCDDICQQYAQQPAVPLKPVPDAPPAVPEVAPPTRPPEQAPPRPLEQRPKNSAGTDTIGPNLAPTSLGQANGAEFPPLAALNGYCIVSLKTRSFVKADPNITSVYKGRTYQFASLEAKAAFDQAPESYCVQFNGADPVELRQSGSIVEGQYLREHEGRLFLFASKQNWEIFKTNPSEILNPSRPMASFAAPAAQPAPAPPASGEAAEKSLTVVPGKAKAANTELSAPEVKPVTSTSTDRDVRSVEPANFLPPMPAPLKAHGAKACETNAAPQFGATARRKSLDRSVAAVELTPTVHGCGKAW